MKNYLVKSLFKIKDPNWEVLDRSHETDLYQHYLDLHNLSLESCNDFLQGDWELKFITGEVDQINQAFEKTFWGIHKLWHSEPCNILYTDPDTLMAEPVTMFGQYDKFMMFNYTDPRSFNKPNRWNRAFPNFFNAGVRYFPHTMSESTWALGTDMAKDWDYSTYDTEQIILNAMFWSQDITIEQAFHPELNWIAMSLRTLENIGIIQWHELWNHCAMNDARIIHFASSRGAEKTKAIMQEAYNVVKSQGQ